MIRSKSETIEVLINEQIMLLVQLECALAFANASKLARPGEPVKADDTPQMKAAVSQLETKIERMKALRNDYLKEEGLLEAHVTANKKGKYE